MDIAIERINKWKFLQILDLSNLNLDELPKLPENLLQLLCNNNNKLKYINKLPKYLKKINISNNYLESLTHLPESLEVLNCINNNIKMITYIPSTLKVLYIDSINILNDEQIKVLFSQKTRIYNNELELINILSEINKRKEINRNKETEAKRKEIDTKETDTKEIDTKETDTKEIDEHKSKKDLINPLYDLNDTITKPSNYNLKSKWLLFLQNVTNTKINNYDFYFLNNIQKLSYTDIGQSNTKILYGDIKYNIIPDNLKIDNKFIDDNSKILVKISKKFDICDNSLNIEAKLYEHVLSKLLYKNYNPHIIGYINYIRDENNNYLYLEMNKGKTFDKFLRTEKVELNDLLSILFQLLYTLSVFNNILLSHNDLHSRNILIENKYINYNYKINNKIYMLKSRYLVKVFDFDNSSIYDENICRNIKLDYQNLCKDENICNVYNNADLYLVLYFFKSILKNEISDLFDKFTINNKLDFSNQYEESTYILNNLKLPVECLEILCESKYTKEIINIKSNLQEEKYHYKLPDIKYFNSYNPKLQKIDTTFNKQLKNNCYYIPVYSNKVLETFATDIDFLKKYYKYNCEIKSKELLTYCAVNNIEMIDQLSIKLVLPFIYGIPNYINHILKENEIDIYNNFSEKVNYILPIEIINIYGNSGFENL